MVDLTFASILRPMKGEFQTIQWNAVSSWSKLASSIVLIGVEDGVPDLAEEFGALLVPVRCNEQGTPLVSDAIATLRAHGNGIVVLVNGDNIFLSDFTPAVTIVATAFPRFLAIGRRRDLTISERLNFDDPGWEKALLARVQSESKIQPDYAVDYFAYRGDLWPEMPDFAIGRSAYDNWMVATALNQGDPIIDMSSAVTMVHQIHGQRHIYGDDCDLNKRLAIGINTNMGTTNFATWELVVSLNLVRREAK